jgi:hypothetical protein
MRIVLQMERCHGNELSFSNLDIAVLVMAFGAGIISFDEMFERLGQIGWGAKRVGLEVYSKCVGV